MTRQPAVPVLERALTLLLLSAVTILKFLLILSLNMCFVNWTYLLGNFFLFVIPGGLRNSFYCDVKLIFHRYI